MISYDLSLESGPKHCKTMVHVLDLLGCVAVGPTTEEALAVTPAAIQAYLRLLHRIGEPVDLEAPVTTRIAEHITQGEWLGNGSPYIMFEPDWEPVSDEETARLLHRFRSLCEELAAWTATRNERDLDATPEAGGRTARSILLHVLGAQGSYLAAALGGAPGFSRLHAAAERGELDLATALRRSGEMAIARVDATTPEERAAVRPLPAGPRTLRKALRRMLEHNWEHLAELARRPGGPRL